MQFVKSYLMYPYKLYMILILLTYFCILKIYICQYYIYVNYIYNIHRISTHNCCIYTLELYYCSVRTFFLCSNLLCFLSWNKIILFLSITFYCTARKKTHVSFIWYVTIFLMNATRR